MTTGQACWGGAGQPATQYGSHSAPQPPQALSTTAAEEILAALTVLNGRLGHAADRLDRAIIRALGTAPPVVGSTSPSANSSVPDGIIGALNHSTLCLENWVETISQSLTTLDKVI